MDDDDTAMTMTNSQLADAYRTLRQRCLALADTLDSEQAATMSPCCPAWSVKDLYAHLVGVPADILDGNLEGAATEAWADAQVDRRADASLEQVCAEWAEKGPQIDEILRSSGSDLPLEFFVDAWTHEWDIRQAVGAQAEPDLAFPRYVVKPMLARLSERVAAAEGKPVQVTVTNESETLATEVLGSGEPTGEATMSLFELMRVSMGRRSKRQITALGTNASHEALVAWTPNEADITDPVTS